MKRIQTARLGQEWISILGKWQPCGHGCRWIPKKSKHIVARTSAVVAQWITRTRPGCTFGLRAFSCNSKILFSMCRFLNLQYLSWLDQKPWASWKPKSGPRRVTMHARSSLSSEILLEVPLLRQFSPPLASAGRRPHYFWCPFLHNSLRRMQTSSVQLKWAFNDSGLYSATCDGV